MKEIMEKILQIVNSPMYGLEFYSKEEFNKVVIRILEIFKHNNANIDVNDC